MKYIVAADTDIGISKQVNQDSVLVKTARCSKGKIALVMVCDGMGGLSKGELASAAVVRSFSDWFENELPYELDGWSWEKARDSVVKRLKTLNALIVGHGSKNGIQLGTTATGIFVLNKQMMTFHVGDTRIYKLSKNLSILTEDHTFVTREVRNGNMTYEEAMRDSRKNALTQCVGVTGDVTPDVRFGNVISGVNYMICSDGFRHVLSEKDIYEGLSPEASPNKELMQKNLRELIELVKLRDEHDNISAAMFRAEF